MCHIILGHQQDEHAQYMVKKLEQRGFKVFLLETHDFPKSVQFSFSPNDGGGNLVLKNGEKVNFSDIESVYWRNFCGVTDESTKVNFTSLDDIAARDSMACIRTWFELNNQTVWINSWKAFQHHQEKPLQLWRVKNLGVNIPKTYIGNDIDEIRRCYTNLEKSIFKPVFGGAHTEILTEAHLESNRVRDALTKAPITVQEFIKGTNIRTYVIGDKVFSAELRSDNADFREDDNLEVFPIETPDDIELQSILIRKNLHLNWTAIDWRRNDSGEYYFLEANPSPMFIGFEKRSGIPISDYLIDFMTQQHEL
jgi:glutathione synthase/RimK-type ligase-like ATP-grasp enzyme